MGIYEGQRASQVSLPVANYLDFDTRSLTDLEIADSAIQAHPGAPGILLCPPPWCRDYKYTPPHSTF